MYGGELSPGLMSLDRRQRRACTRVLEQLIHDFCHPVLLDRASHWCSQPEFGHALCPARCFVLGWPGRRPGHLVPRWSLSHWEARVHHLLCDVSCQVLTKAAPRRRPGYLWHADSAGPTSVNIADFVFVISYHDLLLFSRVLW